METRKVWIVTQYYTVPQYRTKESTDTIVCNSKASAMTYVLEKIKIILDAYDKSDYSGSESDLEWEHLHKIIYNKLNKYNKYDCWKFSNVTFKLEEHNMI